MTLTTRSTSRLILAACAGWTLAAFAGCAPVREDATGEASGGSSLRTALVATDPWTGSQYDLAYVYLVDADHTCQQILNNYGLAWWDLPSDVDWVTANVYRGQFVDWESTYRSQYAWNQEGLFDYTVADFFSGSFGFGGVGGVDGDDVPPAPGGGTTDPSSTRDQEGSLGSDFATREDVLTIRSWTGDRIRGEIASELGDWSFDATYCGDLPGDVVGFPEGDGESVPDAP
jgi:hypothetical protein